MPLRLRHILAVVAVLIVAICTGLPTIFAQNLVLTPTGSLHVGKTPQSITVGDFNADGLLDLATVNSTSDDISILLGNGNGTFRSEVSLDVGKIPMFVASEDINGDHKLDLVVAASGADSIAVLNGRGDGFFDQPVSYPSGKGPTFVTATDLNNDGALDLAVVNSGRFGYYPPFSLSVLLNTGTGLFHQSVQYESDERNGMFPTGVLAEDLTGDGLPDLAVTWSQPAYRTPNGLISIWENHGNGTFQMVHEIKAGLTLSAITGADLDGDRDIDLIAISLFSDSLIVLLQNSDGSFAEPTKIRVGFSPVSLTVKDLDGDGHPDVAVTNRASNGVSILLGQDNGTFRPAGQYGVGSTPSSMVVEDFDGDTYPDLATANSASNDVSVLLSGGGAVPSATLSPDILAFQEEKGTRRRKPQTVVLANIGLGPLTITQVALGGDDPHAFTVTDNTCAHVTLTTGKFCTMQVRLTSESPGSHTAMVSIVDNAPGGPRVVKLRGTIKS